MGVGFQSTLTCVICGALERGSLLGVFSLVHQLSEVVDKLCLTDPDNTEGKDDKEL